MVHGTAHKAWLQACRTGLRSASGLISRRLLGQLVFTPALLSAAAEAVAVLAPRALPRPAALGVRLGRTIKHAHRSAHRGFLGAGSRGIAPRRIKAL
jgi:hypothetical protein